MGPGGTWDPQQTGGWPPSSGPGGGQLRIAVAFGPVPPGTPAAVNKQPRELLAPSPDIFKPEQPAVAWLAAAGPRRLYLYIYM